MFEPLLGHTTWPFLAPLKQCAGSVWFWNEGFIRIYIGKPCKQNSEKYIAFDGFGTMIALLVLILILILTLKWNVPKVRPNQLVHGRWQQLRGKENIEVFWCPPKCSTEAIRKLLASCLWCATVGCAFEGGWSAADQAELWGPGACSGQRAGSGPHTVVGGCLAQGRVTFHGRWSENSSSHLTDVGRVFLEDVHLWH